ncbi:Crp/Fnr family transcriptional regulator [Sphingomonas sp. CROZ-RG-20F-R02-07]|uniref:Crp/Fnr family transcriptional regulator n=1 Tax=Sphingomonas sp. CROZ-RG-20F-R02-07 TaxID=2914832 RepID=UPI001F584471
MTAGSAGGDAGNLSGLKATRPWLFANLDAADRDAFESACGDIRTVSAGTDLLRQDAPTSALHILLDGWAARYKIMEDGSRFIPALAVPGDICDLDALRFDQLDYGVTMLSAGTVAVLPRQRAHALFATNPAIADAFWSLALAENSILTEWAASMGRRSASQRVAHLLCELLVRLTIVGKTDGHSYDLPLTQEHIADTLGLTSVHINRTLQSLRSGDLVTVQHRRVTIHDWAALSAFCGFRPSYLHLETVDDEFAPELPPSGARVRHQLAQASRPTLRPSFTSAPSAL